MKKTWMTAVHTVARTIWLERKTRILPGDSRGWYINLGKSYEEFEFWGKKSKQYVDYRTIFFLFLIRSSHVEKSLYYDFLFPINKNVSVLIKRKNKETIRIKYFPDVYPYQMSLLKFAMQLAKTPSIMIGVFIFFPESYLKKKLWGWKRTYCSCDCCIASSRKRASVESSILACQ